MPISWITCCFVTIFGHYKLGPYSYGLPPAGWVPQAGVHHLSISPVTISTSSATIDSSIPSDKDWVPSLPETQQMDEWFRELDDGSGLVGGVNAAQFLKHTNLSRDTLRTLWALVDSTNRGMVNRYQFYKIIRLVAISTSPIYAGSTPTMERYYQTVNDSLPLPAIRTAVLVPETKLKVCTEAVIVDWVPNGGEKFVMDAWFASLDPIGSGRA